MSELSTTRAEYKYVINPGNKGAKNQNNDGKKSGNEKRY